MALLLLWEVDHGREFVTEGGGGATQKLVGFSRRLQARIPKDAELHAWLKWADVAAPLMPGLPSTHHTRWSVRLRRPAPSEPSGWYEEFLRRWRAYASSLAGPQGASAEGGFLATDALEEDVDSMGRRPLGKALQPATKRRKISSILPARGLENNPEMEVTTLPVSLVASTGDPLELPQELQLPLSRRATAQHPREASELPLAKRLKSADLRQWLRRPEDVASSSTSTLASLLGPGSGHGRAVQGPPT